MTKLLITALLLLCALAAPSADAVVAGPIVNVASTTGQEGERFAIQLDANCVFDKCRFDIEPLDGTAVAGADYVRLRRHRTKKRGEVFRPTFRIRTVDDAVCEPAETFTVRMTGPGGNDDYVVADGIQTILDNDCPPAEEPVDDECETPWSEGVIGAYGAWGAYIDGCTATVRCPVTAATCEIVAESGIYTERPVGHRVTLNARLRLLAPSGAVASFRDDSCAGVNQCETGEIAAIIRGGESASNQCNGVRESASNRGAVFCSISADPVE
jgi:hypothetical protein